MAPNDAAYNSTARPVPLSTLASNPLIRAFTNSTPTVEPEDPSTVSNDTSTAVGAFILSLVFLLGVPGNLFIIWSILARARKKRSVTTLLILNLACADGCLMALTIFFVVYLVKQTWVFGNGMCKALFYLCNANMYASIMLITLMSVQRLVAVVWPRRMSALSGRRTILRLLAALWLLVLLISVPAVVFREEREDTGENGRHRLVCAANHTHTKELIFQYTFETVIGFVLPYGVIVFSYVRILHRLRQTRFRRRIRSEKLILAIVTIFGLFWLPYHVNNMVQVVAELLPRNSPTRERLKIVCQSSRAVTSSLAFMSSCANPVLYTFAGKAYIRREGLGFMARLFEATALTSATRRTAHASRDKEALGLQSQDKDKESTSRTSTPPVTRETAAFGTESK
ncbi:leukotriene B4 receptor 2b [Anguilla anguilla]|uniref:leukotriene B4 receptor 2b n=1 Tax=Anguilla anguilla TaxID=7936 RepID=UPI0015B2500D|nr:leukotriene B4 receptor 2b [Anguilla anguilla]